MTDENQGSIRKTLADALNKIHLEHGVCITLLTADWRQHLGSSRERKSTVASLDIEARL